MTAAWVLVALAAWTLVAVGVGVTVGRTIRRRDQQVPRHDVRTGELGRHHERTKT